MLLSWSFGRSLVGFRYEDDMFRFTDAPLYGWGARTNGALYVELGGRDRRQVEDMSGGFAKTFELEEAGQGTLSFRYRIDMDGRHAALDFADVLAALDGKRLRVDGETHVDRLYGATGPATTTTGWREVEIKLGTLAAGAHELELGGWLSRKNKEATTGIWIDDVVIETRPAAPRLGAFETEVIRLVNDYRVQNGRDALAANAALSAAAEDWSGEMARGDFFRHSDAGRQIAAFGYDALGYGENIAAGQATPRAVVDAWIGSPGHRANLLREGFEDLGVGYVWRANDGGNAPYGHYWTQIFGTPDGDGII